MNRDRLRALLDSVRRGETNTDDALEALARLPFVDTPNARVDTHRNLRHGLPEVVFGPGKTAEQIAEIVGTLLREDQNVLVTRIEPDLVSEVRARIPGCEHDPVGRLLWWGPGEATLPGRGAIASQSSLRSWP